MENNLFQRVGSSTLIEEMWDLLKESYGMVNEERMKDLETEIKYVKLRMDDLIIEAKDEASLTSNDILDENLEPIKKDLKYLGIAKIRYSDLDAFTDNLEDIKIKLEHKIERFNATAKVLSDGLKALSEYIDIPKSINFRKEKDKTPKIHCEKLRNIARNLEYLGDNDK